jgi:hypothetical protein
VWVHFLLVVDFLLYEGLIEEVVWGFKRLAVFTVKVLLFSNFFLLVLARLEKEKLILDKLFPYNIIDFLNSPQGIELL